MGELIGKGAVGEVYKALDTETAKTVAIKQIELTSMSNDNIKSIEIEINLLKNLDHPNIVKYIDFIQTKTHVNIILEYVEGGSLHQLVRQNGMMEHLVFIFVKQILEGLDFLHSQGIIHRDIKGANLLLTKSGIIKLADFGYSVLSDKDKTNSIVGTCCWMAPEIIEQKGGISSSCDIWSLGSTIIQLLTTKPPYYDYPVFGAMYRIVIDECPPLPEGVSDNLTDFLKKCFVKDPTSRATARELLNHPWMTTPNKKSMRKFINENEGSDIPASLINELKRNFRENLSSITSSQNERDKSNSKNELDYKEYKIKN
jgi:serine/threonine protein kinase